MAEAVRCIAVPVKIAAAELFATDDEMIVVFNSLERFCDRLETVIRRTLNPPLLQADI